jgi:uncharacterized protein (TIGR02271 family)
MTIDQNEVSEVMGANVLDSDGDKVGPVGQVYLDDETGQPEWVTVKTGLFGTKESFVPIREASRTGDSLRVPYSKSTIKDAPQVDDEQGHLSPEEEAALYRHYGLAEGTSAGYVEGGQSRTGGGYDDVQARGAVGHDTSGPTTDNAMTRSEEQLHVGTERREAGRARLRKYIVTEQQQVTVPVQREEVRIEREPITEGNRDQAMSGKPISEEEHEVVLHEERPVVQKEAVPVERVRLAKETVTEQVQVNEEVRKEQIETGGIEDTTQHGH